MNEKSGKRAWLFVILAIHGLCWAGLGSPEPRSDDRVYIGVGESIADGSYALNESPKNRRYTVILPALWLRRVGGESPYIISLWPLCCSFATIALLFSWLYPAGKQVAIGASLLLSMNIVQVIFSTVLFPDVIVSLFMMGVIWSVFRRSGGTTHAWYALAFFIAGFFAKEIILLLIPFLLFIAIRDAIYHRHTLFWSVFFAGLVIAYAGLSALLLNFTGDALFLWHSVDMMHNDVFIPPLSATEVVARLTWKPLAWMLSQPGYVFLLILAIPWLFTRSHGRARLWKAYLVILAAALWWGTTSISRFAPVPMYDRMWMPLLVPLCVAAALAVHRLFEDGGERSGWYLYAGLFLAAAIAWPVFLSVKMSLVFLAFSALFLLGARTGIYQGRFGVYARALLLLPYAVTTFYFIVKNTNH